MIKHSYIKKIKYFMTTKESDVLKTLSDLQNMTKELLQSDSERDEKNRKMFEQELEKHRMLLERQVRRIISELIESQEYMERIVASMSDALLDVSPDGSLRFANQAASRLLGYTQVERPRSQTN